MADAGLQWNKSRKCAVTHVKRDGLDTRSSEIEVGESEVITSLKEGTYFKLVRGVMENVKQEDSREEEMRDDRWQGKLLNNRWEDDDRSTYCFVWM